MVLCRACPLTVPALLSPTNALFMLGGECDYWPAGCKHSFHCNQVISVHGNTLSDYCCNLVSQEIFIQTSQYPFLISTNVMLEYVCQTEQWMLPLYCINVVLLCLPIVSRMLIVFLLQSLHLTVLLYFYFFSQPVTCLAVEWCHRTAAKSQQPH